jgi:hypothetical protein
MLISFDVSFFEISSLGNDPKISSSAAAPFPFFAPI